MQAVHFYGVDLLMPSVGIYSKVWAPNVLPGADLTVKGVDQVCLIETLGCEYVVAALRTAMEALNAIRCETRSLEELAVDIREYFHYLCGNRPAWCYHRGFLWLQCVVSGI